MVTDRELLRLAEQCRFDHAGIFSVSLLRVDPAVREMCTADRCRSYGKRWTCPPGCGTLEEMAAKIAGRRRGVLLQSTGTMEDEFDIDAMQCAEEVHKGRFARYVTHMRKYCPDCLPMSAGTCTLCSTCTYPDAPCRLPQIAVPSMEAYGLMVSQVCADCGVPYYYGPRSITYSSCVLLV